MLDLLKTRRRTQPHLFEEASLLLSKSSTPGTAAEVGVKVEMAVALAELVE